MKNNIKISKIKNLPEFTEFLDSVNQMISNKCLSKKAGEKLIFTVTNVIFGGKYIKDIILEK